MPEVYNSDKLEEDNEGKEHIQSEVPGKLVDASTRSSVDQDARGVLGTTQDDNR